MSDPFVAEIRIFGFHFAPKGWAYCDGQILPISQNTALFSLLGTIYGGDGKFTFALPNLQGHAPMAPGQGPGLSNYFVGQDSGSSTVTLLESEIPAHSHSMFASGEEADVADPASSFALANSFNGAIYSQATPNVNMLATTLATAGGDQPHNNMQPYLTVNFCIALQGIFPPRQ